MDLERMEIQVHEDSFREHKNQIAPRYYRSGVRKTDLAGRFKWFRIELTEIAQQFSKPFDEVAEIFE